MQPVQAAQPAQVEQAQPVPQPQAAQPAQGFWWKATTRIVSGAYYVGTATTRWAWSQVPSPIRKPVEWSAWTMKWGLIAGVAYKTYDFARRVPFLNDLVSWGTNVTFRLSDYGWEKISKSTSQAFQQILVPIFERAILKGQELLRESVDTLLSKLQEGVTFVISEPFTVAGWVMSQASSLLLKTAPQAAWKFATSLNGQTWALIAGYVTVLYLSMPSPRPSYAIKCRRVTRISQFKESIAHKIPYLNWEYLKDQAIRPIFNPEITARLNNITLWNRNILKNGGCFQNILLEGVPGGGKTMFAELCAKESEFNFVSASGSDLVECIKNGGSLARMEELMTFGQDSRFALPTVLFIDEIDAFGRNRGELEHHHRMLLDWFLSKTGTPNSKLLVIGATNRKSDLDPALLDRFDHKIHVAVPDLSSRVQILTQYVDQSPLKASPERNGCLNEQGIHKLATLTYGLSGRALQKLVTSLNSTRAATADNCLTEVMIEQVAYNFVKENRENSGLITRVITWLTDFWYFDIPRIRRACSPAFQSIRSIFRRSEPRP